MTARECAHLGTKSSAPRPRATLAETANTASVPRLRGTRGRRLGGRDRYRLGSSLARDEAGAAPPRTRPGRLPDGPGRGDSPRPWHVRFRGNLSTTLPKVACNSIDRTFLITQKRWNCNDTISIHKRLTGKLHATLLGNHDDAPYTIRSRPGQVEKHANTKPPPGSTGTTPAAPPPGRHHTTTSRKSTHNNTKGSGLNKPPQNPGLDAPAKGHCTRYVALHPLRGAAPVTSRCTRYVALHPNRRGAMPTDRVQCLHIGCTTPRHKLRCGPARMEVDGPDRLGCARRRRTPHNQQRPTATNPQQLTAPAATHPQQLTAPAATHPQQPTGPEGGRA